MDLESIEWVVNTMPKSNDVYLPLMKEEFVKQAKSFHESFPQYEKTPLARLSHLSEYLGIGELYVKDESFRFGLNAFKVLGGSFAMANYIAKQTNQPVSALPYSVLTSKALRETFGQATFFTATDGNHGRGVAWAANKLSQKAVVYMPKGTTLTRMQNIQKEHAVVTIEEVNYDECVRMAAASAAKTPNGVIIQDTAWEGYEEIPTWIMQGYGTMAMETKEQLLEYGCEWPTHILIQAGVGSLAGAVQGYFANSCSDHPPIVAVVEAKSADCLYQGALAGDGSPHTVGGDMPTIMAGLACGEPNTIAWDILKNHASVFVSCPDWVAKKGMRMAAAPLKGDSQVISGESGSVTLGLLASILTTPKYKELKDELKINQDSRILLFSTEGDTDPRLYRSIVWGDTDSTI